MLAIKLKRIGRRNQPSYRIVIGEKRSKVRGKYTEDIGWYNPQSKESNINTDRAHYWLEKGAHPTESVHNLFVHTKIVKGKKRPVHSTATKQEEAPSAVPEKANESAPVEENAEQAIETEKNDPQS